MSSLTSAVRPQQDGVRSSEGAVSPHAGTVALVEQLRGMSIRGLARMYDPAAGVFVFRLRRTGDAVVAEGRSPRYTAITLIGLAGESAADRALVTGPHTSEDICSRLLREVATSDNLGDVALTVFAAGLLGQADQAYEAARRLSALSPVDGVHPVVELAWTLTALTMVPQADKAQLRDRVAERLMATFNPVSSLFPHVAGATGARAHVSCFADLIYPIQALSLYATATGSQRALDIAAACATHLCALQGADGQWWWHYDYRTGAVIEGYPVYAIHQDAMGPMGLHDLREAKGPDFTASIIRGLDWLASSPELGGASLIDTDADLIWRKVARREPGKTARYVQAAASRVHSSLRMPAMDLMFPAAAIDYEDRPYHLGWLLHAWPGRRVMELKAQGVRA
jgi:hypothetical protein